MKNTRLITSIVLIALLCASIAYWALKLIRPEERPLAAPQQARQEINLDAAAGLFGGRKAGAAVASNFQLLGVIDARSDVDSVAIIASTGKPAQAVAVGAEVVPGVIVREVHPRYVLLSENGVSKRIDLPEKMPPSKPVAPVPTSPAQAAPAASQPGMPTPKMLPPASQTPAQPVQPAVKGQPASSVRPTSQSRASRRARQANTQAGFRQST